MDRGNNLCRRLGRFIIELNLFKTDVTNPQTIKIQRWSTRIHTILLFCAMCILLVYNASTVKTQQIEVKHPSFETYYKLKNAYDTDIKCPCAQISAPYRSFLQLVPVYHEICSSFFVSQTWINMLFDDTTFIRYVLDFRATASNQFQVLRELCTLSQTTINRNMQTFYNDELISGYLLSEPLIKAEITTTIAVFQASSRTNFLHLISFLRSFVFGNQYLAGIETPYALQIYSYDGLNWMTAMGGNSYVQANTTLPSCQCYQVATCSLWSAFYNKIVIETGLLLNWRTTALSLRVENWFVGCWPLESLLISSVEDSFLYNQSALDVMAMYFNWSSNSMPIALNVSKEANQSSTFNDVLHSLFVESFSTEFNYSLYFAQCRPLSCLYSINQHSSFLYIVTTLLGLYGGVSVVFRLIIPYIVAFLVRRLNPTPPQRDSDDIGKFESKFCE